MTDLEWLAIKRMADKKFCWGSMKFQYLPFTSSVLLTYEPYKRIAREYSFYPTTEIDKDMRSRLRILYDKYYERYHTSQSI